MRYRSKAYLKTLRGLPCLVCGQPSEAHHVTYAEPNALSRKVGDNWCVPLCRTHHSELHLFGDERLWWAIQGIDPLESATELFNKFKENK